MEENITRRTKLAELMDENSIAIIYSGVSKIATEDEFYPFKVNNHFFYLTNVQQENSILVLVKEIGRVKTYLFIDEYNEVVEKWTGRTLSDDEAKELSNIDSIYHTKDFESFIPLFFASENNQYGKISKLYIDLTPELKIKDAYSTLDFKKEIEEKYPHIAIENVYPIITDLRMVKSDYEIKQLQEAIKLTKAGINDLISKVGKGMFEYELANEFSYFGMAHGRHGLAFDTIVASGKSAVILHYPQQTERVMRGDLVLFDLGYSYNGYNADVSRTYPVNGKFNPLQREIYEAVLNCNRAVIEYIHEGLTLMDLQKFSMEVLKNECVKRGLLKEEDDIRRVYYHGISHHLGLDTHDASERTKPLANGHVITVEPGLYFKEYGIGVRIEDDVLVKDGVACVLTSSITKDPDEIEKIMATLGN